MQHLQSQSGSESTGRHVRIGDLLVAGGFVLPTEIDAASREQHESHVLIGDILVIHGELEAQERDATLRVQETLEHHPESDFRLDAEARVEANVRLGDLLVEHGDLDTEELNEALRAQRDSCLPLGEVLVTRGAITEHQLDRVVSIQRRLLGAVMAVGMTMATAGEAQGAPTTDTGSDTTVSSSADLDATQPATLSELLPRPDISELRDTGDKVVNAAAVTLGDFAQDISNLFERVEFSGMQSHFGAMDANTARDRSEYEITDDAYLGVSFRINFSSRAGEQGEREMNLNFVPDEF